MVAIASDSTLVAVTLWLMYAALEPYCRRFWPDMLLGWSRLLSGHLRDSRVGRDVLAGLGAGVLWLLIDLGRRLLPMALGQPPIVIRNSSEIMFTGTLDAVRIWCVLAIRTLVPGFMSLMLFVVLRLVTRRQAVATALGMVAIFYWWSMFGTAPVLWVELIAEVLIVTLFTFVMIRFGLLAALIALFISSVGQVVPLTLDMTHWSASASNHTVAFVVALACFGFYAARAGQPLFGKLELET